MAERTDFIIGSTAQGSVGQVPIRVQNTTSGDVEEMTLDDATGAATGSSANPLVVNEGNLDPTLDGVFTRAKETIISAAPAGTAITTATNAVQSSVIAAVAGNAIYKTITVRINISGWTQTLGGTDRSVKFNLFTYTPSGTDPTAYFLCSSASIIATTFGGDGVNPIGASGNPLQLTMEAGVGTPTGTGNYLEDFLDGIELTASFGATASGQTTLTFSYEIEAK